MVEQVKCHILLKQALWVRVGVGAWGVNGAASRAGRRQQQPQPQKQTGWAKTMGLPPMSCVTR